MAAAAASSPAARSEEEDAQEVREVEYEESTVQLLQAIHNAEQNQRARDTLLLRHVRAVSTSNNTFISELEKCMSAVHELITESKELSGRLDSLLQERRTELDAVRRACPVSTLQSTRFRAKLSCALRSAFLRKVNVETEHSSSVEEVDHLRSQRFVHTLLSNNFRERLERVMSQGQVLPMERRRQQSRPFRTAAAAAEASEPMTPPPPPPLRSAQGHQEALRSRGEMMQQQQQEAPPAPTIPTSSSSSFDAPDPALRSSQEIPLWRRLYEIRESMQAAELADLHIRRSVSSILESDFRNRLEALIQDIINQQHVPPPPPLPRAAGPPFLHHHHHHHHQQQQQHGIDTHLSDLQHRVVSLEVLVRQCLEVQTEMRRFLSQEVSSALNFHRGGPFDQSLWKAANVGQCVICCAAPVDCAMYRCGHMCTCLPCARQLQSKPNHFCPMCRAPITDVLKLYSPSNK